MKLAFKDIVKTIALALVIYIIVQFMVTGVEVQMTSMEPTLHQGQRLMVDKVTYWFKTPQRGDIVVFYPPRDSDELYIKRIIATPGETIEIKQGKVLINGNSIEEPYISFNSTAPLERQVIPADNYFVMGDNRNGSYDSRAWGPVTEDSIVGKAWVLYWPFSEWGMAPNYSFAASGE